VTKPRTTYPNSAAVRVGDFLAGYYDRDGEIHVYEMVADLMDLCRRFDLDFDAVLEEARAVSKLSYSDGPEPGLHDPVGTGARRYTVCVDHEVTFSGKVEVLADDEDQALATAKAHFCPTWDMAGHPEVRASVVAIGAAADE
jgi:hypothetical protein